jgi:hypothetical protein
VLDILIFTQKHSVAEAFLYNGVPLILLSGFSFKMESQFYLPYSEIPLQHTVESQLEKEAGKVSLLPPAYHYLLKFLLQPNRERMRLPDQDLPPNP